MRTIAHISDLHFGREDPPLVEALLAELEQAAPTLVAVSGDLTQRARPRQFAAVRAFLDRISAPILVVPGNHDVPLYEVVRRFVLPLERYRRYITSELAPRFRDEELAVFGVNTARSATWKNGRISLAQIDEIRSWLCAIPPSVFKVVVTHHPFIPPPDDPTPALVGRGLQALRVAEACGVDLLLAGHLHVGYTGDVRGHHVTIRRSILVAQAGTATSTRLRSQPNGYNLITVDPRHPPAEPPHLALVVRAWDGSRFAPVEEGCFVKMGDEWQPERPLGGESRPDRGLD